MESKDLSKQETKDIDVKEPIDISKQVESQEKLLRLFQILHQINIKKKIVKIPTYEEVKNIRNTNNTSQTV